MRDPKFQENEFFDPHDLVQVKYEMLRRVSVENASVTEATEEYGVSRPTYYQTKASFDKGGLAGLVPRKRGPHGPINFRARHWHSSSSNSLRASLCGHANWQSWFGRSSTLTIHPRTIERAVAGKKTSR